MFRSALKIATLFCVIAALGPPAIVHAGDGTVVSRPDSRFIRCNEQGGQHPTGAGSLFTVIVNYGDEQWQSPGESGDYNCNSMEPAYFPAYFPVTRQGTDSVTVEYVGFPSNGDTTPDRLLALLHRHDVRCPDRAEAESFRRQYPCETANHVIIAVSGITMSREGTAVASESRDLGVWYMVLDWGAINVGQLGLRETWNVSSWSEAPVLFLAVRNGTSTDE